MALTDLAEFRLIRAVRAGQLGAFASLWNAWSGSVWSVVRALASSDADAVGWMSAFRLDLERRAPTLDPEAPLGQQVGCALLEHLAPSFTEVVPLPRGGLPATEEGLGVLPDRVRLLYLVWLFFDVPDDALRAVGGVDAARLVHEASRRLEPDQDTDAHLLAHAALLKNPPAAAMILPPGAEPPPRPTRWPLAVAAVLFLLAGLASPWAREQLFRTSWEKLARAHAETLASEGLLLGSDAADLASRLSRAGVPSTLSVVPILDSAGLTLVGGRVMTEGPPAVALVYQDDRALWTLQHHERAPPADGRVLTERITPDGPVTAYDTDAGVVVGWSEHGDLWVLTAAVPEADLLTVAAAIRAARRPTPPPWPGLQ